jgi:hypothetical protein
MQGYQIIGNLWEVVGPRTCQEAVPLGQPDPALLVGYVWAHASTVATDGDIVLSDYGAI